MSAKLSDAAVRLTQAQVHTSRDELERNPPRDVHAFVKLRDFEASNEGANLLGHGFLHFDVVCRNSTAK